MKFILGKDEISQAELLCQWHPVIIPKFSEVIRTTQSQADCMARSLILYTCGNGTKNNWIQKLRDVI